MTKKSTEWVEESSPSVTADRGRGTGPALQPRGERADQVAQDRLLAEDRRGAQPTHGGSGMMIIRAALTVVLALGLLAAPLTAADAQQAGKVPRIGFLGALSLSDTSPRLDAFRQALRELGWIEGQNIVIDYRYAEGTFDRLPDLAAKLVQLKVDIIVAVATQGVTAAKNATETIPIVMISGSADPVGLGFIASLARPGGNVTGLSFSVGPEIVGKQLELLREIVPTVRRAAILSNPASPIQPRFIREVNAAAQSLGVQLQLLEARGPKEFDGAFAAMATERVGALLVVADGGVHPPPNTARRPRSKEPPAGSIRP